VKLFNLTADGGLKIFRYCYLGWILLSFLIAMFWSDNIACLYVDAPLWSQKIPSFFLSLAYMDVFIPALLAVAGYGFVTIIYVAHKCRSKDSL
jgi:hypothetical protein